jgi:16S rRNA (cytosine967-C5)-methyltransferase
MNQHSPSSNLRVIACQILNQVLSNQQSLSSCLEPATTELSSRDKALVQELVFGSCRWYYALQQQCQSLMTQPLAKKYQLADPLLVIGAYQLQFMRIPSHAAINETVEAAQALGLRALKGMINAILRKLAKQNIAEQANAHAQSHPAWIQAKVQHNWPSHAEQIFAANNQKPPMMLRVNPQQTTVEEYLARLRESDIEAHPCEFASHGIRLEKPCLVSTLPDFDKGACSVQDEAAQLCTQLLDLQPNMRVLDACAAPGGKTCAMLESQASLKMTALDSDVLRAKRISENLERLTLSATIKIAAAEKIEDWWDQQAFDRILLDAPCSATGVIRRHPDIKLLRREGDIKQLAALQLEMLQALWKTLASGGKLVYATCSIFPQENSRIIERFLKQERSASLVTIDAEWGQDTGFGRQLFPRNDSHDGFFYACLSKLDTH